MKKKNGVNYSEQLGVVNRRRNVILRLETQLKKGIKSNNGEDLPLTDKDVNRINKELVTLKLRLVVKKA